MLFHTAEFFFLLIITFICYYLFRNARLVILSVANCLFYAAASWGFLGLFLGMSFTSYLIARRIPKGQSRFWLTIGIILNVANLAFFKYSMFIIQNLEAVTGLTLVAKDGFWAHIVLPIGISFYTFQLIAYLTDVYKGRIEPTDSYLRFWVFIAFFPHQLAGPIMRGHEFMPQVERTHKLTLTPTEFKYGVYLILWGLAKKILIADQVSPIVDEYFKNPADLTMAQAWTGAYLFGFQIYADFSAYSDMAVGLGYLFGYRLPLNFLSPYISANATEFWRRWHITLSSWIRDYIYIPLGGSRKGRLRKDVNLLAAMLISGLWHGAMWTFVIWGFLHGMLLIIHKWYADGLKKLLDALPSPGKAVSRIIAVLYRIIAVVLFFHITTVTWVFFRAESVQDAFDYITAMFDPAGWANFVQQISSQAFYLQIVLVLYAAHLLEYIVRRNEEGIAAWWHRLVPSPVRGIVYALLVFVVIAMIKGEKHDFIYFQF
ncbi:MBOAT family O-acyltransferase [Aneurinibacillus thermoaerophilus]|uniref:MBOAT family protein n=1 Tax=Aneurinibacillus thermoaerophilus TaxID=143495 RepID=A0ABX8YAX7_ANETH|nr:MBOAT family O-acyltransferase [Aneurinibacillus thermoaerophilus]QYY42530.1 MBOAT family protein [Aneurinibacillus thermoaerophilus]